VIAWIAIVVMVGVVVWRQGVRGEDEPNVDDPIGVALMQFQTKVMVATSATGAGAAGSAEAAAQFYMGSVDQRQRAIIVVADQDSPEAAAELVADLDRQIENQLSATAARPPDERFELTPEQARVQEILHRLYDTRVAADEAGRSTTAVVPQDVLGTDDELFLRMELGWFGDLALAPAWMGDSPERDAVERPGEVLLAFLMVLIVAGIGVGVLGLAGLVVMIILACLRRLSPGLPGRATLGATHGIYAETFAIWMAVFFGLNVLAGLATASTPALALPATLAVFFGSLLVLAWPVMRGISWREVRQDIGWTLGRAHLGEVAVGVAGYAMALPILAVGLGMTLMLAVFQQFLQERGQDSLESTAGPSHPIVEYLISGDWPTRIVLLVVAAVAAPIVEETMFRGVFYRHLRGAGASLATWVSVVLATLINALVFAAIHPQGWVAIPALMSLAIAFSLMREWRGTVIPSMLMHGLSNFIVMTLAIAILSS